MIEELKRGVEILRQEGPATLLGNTKNYLNRVEIGRDGVSISYQKGSRVDFEDRYRLLENEIGSDDSSLLDIGCAEGDFAARFADRGLFSIGIERQQHTVANARKRHANQPGLGFLEFEITPDTIDGLPEVDVILLLTVYHHWVSEYSDQQAQEMLEKTIEKCDTLLFEIPNRHLTEVGDPQESTVEYYLRYLEEAGDGADVKFLGRTDYKGEDRKDILFSVR